LFIITILPRDAFRAFYNTLDKFLNWITWFDGTTFIASEKSTSEILADTLSLLCRDFFQQGWWFRFGKLE